MKKNRRLLLGILMAALFAVMMIPTAVSAEDGDDYTVLYNDNGVIISVEGEFNKSVKPGGTAVFKVKIEGASDPNYQWGELIQNGDNFTHTLFEGETGNTFTATNLTTPRCFTCVFGDGDRNIVSLNFGVVIDNPYTVKLTTNKDTIITPGDSLTFNANVECESEQNFTYKWYTRETVFDGTHVEYTILDEQGASLTLENIDKYMEVACSVFDIYGNEVGDSVNIVLNNELTAKAKDDLDEYAVQDGGSATLTVDASARAGALHYTWSRSDYDMTTYTKSNTQAIDDAASSTLTVSKPDKLTCYSCKVSDDYKSETTVDFYVRPDSGLKQNDTDWKNLEVTSGSSAQLKADFSINTGETITYRWTEGFHDGEDGVGDWTTISGETTNEYTVPSVTKTRWFRCYGTDQYGYTVDMIFRIDVKDTTPVSDDTPSSPSTPSTPSTPATTPTTVEVPVSGDSDTAVKISASISDGTAEVAPISKDDIAKAGTTEAITIDLAGTTTAEVNAVTLTKETVENLAASDAPAVEIKLDSAEALIDAATLDALAQQAEGSKVELSIDTGAAAEATMTPAQKEAVKDMASPLILDASFISAGKKISDFKGGNVTLTVPYVLKNIQAAIRAWFVNDQGGKERVDMNFDGKYAKLNLKHFSHYVIEEYTPADNTLTAKGKTVTVKASKVKKAKVTIAAKKALTVKDAVGTVTYKKVSGKSNLKVNAKTGKITVKKGTEKGTYKIKVKVSAAGNDDYLAGSKTVKVTVKVK